MNLGSVAEPAHRAVSTRDRPHSMGRDPPVGRLPVALMGGASQNDILPNLFDTGSLVSIMRSVA